MLCQLVVQPVVRLIQLVVATIEYMLIHVCRLIEEVVEVVSKILKWVCNTLVKTVCGAVCSVVCGICDFICGFFGCDCGCRNVCDNVCKQVSDVVCGWTEVVEKILKSITTLVCSYILKALIALINVVVAIVTMLLTWICTLIDWLIRWILCWTYIAELFNSRAQRRFRVAPKVIPNGDGHSAWFIYVNTRNRAGAVDQNLKGYILSDRGRPLTPAVDPDTANVTFFEVDTDGDVITGELRREDGELVPSLPFLYYPAKLIEISSHMLGDMFAGGPGDDGRGASPEANLFTYNPAVQSRLDTRTTLARNNYNLWPGKYTNPAAGDFFGDRSLPDMGMRVDTDDTCGRPTNTFLHLVSPIAITPGDSGVAEKMTCGSGQTLTLDQTNFLMYQRENDACAVTTYFVSSYDSSDSSVGCNDLLGYTVNTFTGWAAARAIEYSADAVEMMARIVDNISGSNSAIVRAAETYLHESGHQSGLLHDTDSADCANDATLHIAKLMNPGASVRRALTRMQWCMVRNTCYVTSESLEPFLEAPELGERLGTHHDSPSRRKEEDRP